MQNHIKEFSDPFRETATLLKAISCNLPGCIFRGIRLYLFQRSVGGSIPIDPRVGAILQAIFILLLRRALRKLMLFSLQKIKVAEFATNKMMGAWKLPAGDYAAEPLLQTAHSSVLPKRIRPLYSYFNKWISVFHCKFILFSSAMFTLVATEKIKYSFTIS